MLFHLDNVSREKVFAHDVIDFLHVHSRSCIWCSRMFTTLHSNRREHLHLEISVTFKLNIVKSVLNLKYLRSNQFRSCITSTTSTTINEHDYFNKKVCFPPDTATNICH